RLYVHHQVVTTKEAMAILDLASRQTDEDERAVVRFPCICRYQVDGEDPGSHCYGIAFTDEYTRRFPKYLGGNHDYVSAEIAIDTLEKMVLEEPIVHAVSALRVPYIGLLCNCDMRVCQPYIKRLRLGIDSPFHKGHYAATVDEDSCSVCGTCENVCPFGAAAIDEKDVCARINVEACFGCGICMGRCPEEAISLVEAPRETGF
ncbi:MAG: 4Fe-4S binding protein, partial [Candidatus Thorarchaeota archaeon]